MRDDPELVMRAQQAAAELERAWDRWRTVHGLGTEPLPPVSSYVGYSLGEPWGQPRVVFGIDAREAEQLASLLDRHDCAGPVYASVASMAGSRAGDAADTRVADADRQRGAGRVRVPTQGQPGAAHRERPRDQGKPDALLGPLDSPGQREAWPGDKGKGGPGAAAAQGAEPPAGHEAPAPKQGHGPDGAQPAGLAGPAAFRPELEPAPPADGQEPGRIIAGPGEAAEPAEPDRNTAGWTRANRMPGGHALPRQKRAGGAGRGTPAKQEGRDRSGLEAMAAELVGWAPGERPGQASHRCLPRPVPGQPSRY